MLTAPFTPMLFMGEEWAATTPWQYFTSYQDVAIGQAVADGRRAEFAQHGWRAEDVPDPQDPATFARSRLDWSQVSAGHHREVLTWYRQLLALRRQYPDLTDPRLDRVHASWSEPDRWLIQRRGQLLIAANLGQIDRRLPLGAAAGLMLAASADGVAVADAVLHLPARSFAVVAV